MGVFAEPCHLLGFGGTNLLESPILRIFTATTSLECANAHHRESLVRLLPVYKASPKHRAEEYFDRERHETVAAMPLSDQDAQETLLRGIEYAGDYWSFHCGRRVFIRFKATLGNEYHGFQVAKEEIPAEVVIKL